ncbi:MULTISPECIES: putative ABC transporter permease [unclassified Candidatus Paralachnospira]|uniref:putative ABC transporter permease n=1 Tax=unclassified Candidatus Paralachnospira TaxID=3099471 RepID=UPI003F8DAEC3
MSYSFQQWLLFFYIYCFFGWCFESTYVSLRKHRFVNRGFLHSPLLPIYGSGAVVMLLVTLRIRSYAVLMFFAGMIGATALELVVGLAMEAIFEVKYWDYSNQKFNYKGVICLSSSLCWGLFTVLLNKVIHQPVEAFVLGLPAAAVTVTVCVISVIFLCDTVVSVKVALGIRDMLDARVRLKKELGELQEGISEQLGTIRGALGEKSSAVKEQMGALLDSLGERVAELSQTAGSRMAPLLDTVSDKLSALIRMEKEEDAEKAKEMSRFREKLVSIRSEGEAQKKKMDYLKLKMLRRNPSASAGKMSAELSELRENYEKWRLERKEKQEKK